MRGVLRRVPAALVGNGDMSSAASRKSARADCCAISLGFRCAARSGAISGHTLDSLAKAHAVAAKSPGDLRVNGRFGYDARDGEQAAAWRAIMLSYPELLEAARAGLQRP